MTEEELKEVGCLTEQRHLSTMFYKLDDYVAVEMWPYTGAPGTGDVYTVEFVVYEANEWFRGNDERGVHFQRKDSVSSPNPVDSLDDAEWSIIGGVKWDGCVNYKYNQESCLLHQCGLYGFETEARVWKFIYQCAETLMPNYDWESLRIEIKETP